MVARKAPDRPPRHSRYSGFEWLCIVDFGDLIAKNEANIAIVKRFLEDPSHHFFLLGPRGTGKSTWLRMVFPDALVVDLLAPEVERRYQARPERLRELVKAHPECEVLVVDEVQNCSGLFPVPRYRDPQNCFTGGFLRKSMTS